VRDSHGMVHASVCNSVDALVDSAVAKSQLVALRTVEFCRNWGFSTLMLEGDSLIVVNALNRTGLNWSMYGNIIADIQAVFQGFHSWKICHTQWRANLAAHTLAKEGVHQATPIGPWPSSFSKNLKLKMLLFQFDLFSYLFILFFKLIFYFSFQENINILRRMIKK
jgi:hypothetical protein